jgi:hypothetical protein
VSEGPADDLPDRAEFRREMARVDDDFATARRYLSALSAGDHAGCNAVMVKIHTSKRALHVLAALAQQALDFGRVLAANGLLADTDGEPCTLQHWLDHAAMGQMDVAEEDKRELGDD